MGATTTRTVLHPLLGGRTWESEDGAPLTGVDGRDLVDVRQSPTLLAQLALRRAAESAGPALPERQLAEAGRIFVHETLDGESPQEYCRRAALATGVPHAVYSRALHHLGEGVARAAADVAAELPAPQQGSPHEVRWVRRGRTVAVVAPSNHPEPHLTWVKAVALGHGVVVRPGGRDPFTPLRLARALYAAGLPAHRLSVLPGEYGTADFLVKHADRAVVYGGPDTVARWAGRATVALRGPGRSKVLLGPEADDTAIAHTARTIAADGGVRCTNTSVVLTTGDVRETADALAAELAGLEPLPVLDPRAALPAFTADRATALAREVDRLAAQGLHRHPTTATGPHGTVELADGSHVLPPVVLSTTDPAHPVLGTELPFPFTVVAPWTAETGTGPLRDSLVVTLLGAPADLAEQLLLEPTVRRVVLGPADPWATAPGLPHDGSLTQFLLEPKAFIRAEVVR
ncbi:MULTISPECIES: aldehyde dehydrogenase family protein [Streptomyces]|uniref:aldehyde dehydrogenase family protein n=1 Tax=Streptomyces TaxID=1883 RepID=UPI000A3713F0|nr:MULTISPECIES: aldehyde dehydrogenase family protein [Streptomyces]MDN5383866.1 aldehyde dehydrogenase family protein [Streptomyces sp. LB8]